MKKTLSIILSLILVMSTLPMIASATEGEQQEITFLVTDTICVDVSNNSVSDASNSGEYNIGTNAKNMYVVYRFNLPMGALGIEVDEATLSYWDNNDYNATDSFFPVPYGTWTSADDVTADYIASVKAADDSANYVGSAVQEEKNRAAEEHTANVTKAVQDAVASGSSKVALSFNWSTGWYTTLRLMYNEAAASKEPKLTVKYRVVGVPEMLLKSVSVNNGDTIDTNDSITFTYSNAIDASEVSPENFVVTNFAGESVSISDSDISVSGATVTINKTWDSHSAYEVAAVNITDLAKQTLASAGSVSFKTGADSSATQTVKVGVKDTQAWNASSNEYMCQASSGSESDYFFPKNTDNFQDGYIVYRFELPSIGAGMTVSSATLKYWHNYDWMGTDNWFVVPFGDWTEPSTVWNTEYVDAVNAAADKYTYVGGVTYDNGNVRKIAALEVDISSAINAALAVGEDKIALTFHGGDYNTKTYTRTLYNEGNTDYAPELIINYTSPEFAVVSATPEKGETMNGIGSSVEMTLATTLADESEDYKYADYIKLVNASNNSEVAAEVIFDAASGKLTVNPSADLAERTLYKVVFKAGLKDAYGNVLADDKTATAFTTKTGLEFYGIKFTAEESPVYDDCIEIESYTANSSVTAVAKVKNGSSKDLDAVMIIALYGEGDELIAVDAIGGVSCAPANEETQYAKSISVPEKAEKTKIKAFMWDGLDNIRPAFDCVEVSQAQ